MEVYILRDSNPSHLFADPTEKSVPERYGCDVDVRCLFLEFLLEVSLSFERVVPFYFG